MAGVRPLREKRTLKEVATAAARAVWEEVPYVRRGDFPPTVERDGLEELQAYYIGLGEETMRILDMG